MTEKRRVSMRLREPAPKRLAVTTRSSTLEKPSPVPVTKSAPKGTARTATKLKLPISPPKEPTPPPLDPLELLPNKLVEREPLPSLDKPQGEVPGSKWQTIAESGVLLASINRSRQRWIHECIFEKYWSKSTYKKKKDPADVEKKDNRPPMTKAGTCKIIVEPHIFDATIFVVRDQTPNPPQMQGERQFVQYGPTSTPPSYSPQYVQAGPSSTSILHRPPQYVSPQVLPKTTQSATATTSQTQPTATQHQSQSGTPVSTSQSIKATPTMPQASAPKPTSPATVTIPAGATTLASPESATSPSKIATQPQTSGTGSSAARVPPKQAAPATNSSAPRPYANTSTPTPASRPQPAARPTTTSRPPAPSTNDPVIQMLAQRASTNPELKRIMKIVATGKASGPELTYFQGHIDELQKIVEERKARDAAAAQMKQSIPPQQKGPLAGPTSGSGVPRQPTYHTPNRVPLPPPGASQAIAQRPMYNTPQPQKPKLMAPPPLHVLIELAQNNVDRFLFPKYSILEQLSPHCMLVSFLIVKKPSQLAESDAAEAKKSRKKVDKTEQPADGADSKTTEKSTPKPKEEEKEVYQPITIRLESPSDGNLFSLISRVVAPVEQVQKHMREIAEKCEMAEKKYLALRLPKEARDMDARAH